ncbi:MAG: hypothetical protein E4H40_03140 [Candidatus Brocadiia bacterium]|nr:MAG: hypothetical protein E4H40_03140 [Candidatus Brocadiia bacterium]
MPMAIFYFQLHQPFRLNPDGDTFLWEEQNKEIFQKVFWKCYLPATRMFTEIINEHPDFKVCFSMSGIFLEQAELYEPEVIQALQELFTTGKNKNQVEYMEETYYHSLTSLFRDKEKTEFKEQVSMHRQKMLDIFGIRPTSFRNTELMYNNDIGNMVADMGFKSILCEQRDDMYAQTDGQNISPNAIFRAIGRRGRPRNLVVIPRNRNLSDDVAFRFTNSSLSSSQYAEHIAKIDGEAALLGYDYEHIGEHIWADKGIFEFWRNLPKALAEYPNIVPSTPTEVAEKFREANCPVVDIHPLSTSSWADVEKNTLGWLGSATQYKHCQSLEKMESASRKADTELLKKFRYLTTSDHLYYMHEGVEADKSVHDYFSPYGSLAAATYILTHTQDSLFSEVHNFNILKKTDKTPVIIITPETARLQTEGLGRLAPFVSGKSGGLGEVVSALCKALSQRRIPVHLITLNLKKRFRQEAGISEEEWIHRRHGVDSENIHLVSSSLFEDYKDAYDGEPAVTAAEFQKQIINTYIKEIQSDYEGRAVIHTHDWIAGGTIAAYAKLRDIPLLHTIHNTHTGHIPIEMMRGVNLRTLWEKLFISWDSGRRCIDSQATAIKNASLVSYVGKKFLQEVVGDYFMGKPVIPWSVRQETKAKYFSKGAVVIANGISPDLFPENQKEALAAEMPGLAKKYGPDDDVILAKKLNLVKFQKKMGLNIDPEAILLYWPSRLDTFQKGIQLLEDIAHKFVIEHPDVQIAVVGNPVVSNGAHAEIMGRIACVSGGKIAYRPFDEDLSILGYAAAGDVFGASLYEPFGQIDVVGNVYGATATNRDTGGYSDKIVRLALEAWGAPIDRGNGVLFRDYDSAGLWWGLSITVENHGYFRKNPQQWEKQAKRIMKQARNNWSLENMVAGYILAYEKLNGGKPLV